MKSQRRVTGVIVLIAVFTIVLIAGGCATIISGKSQEMTFTSEPDGALVTVSGREIGKTPVTVRLDKAKNQSVTVQKEGYKPVTMQLTTTINGWFWGNILIGGLIGSTTDGLSGAVYEYAPSQYYFPLTPIEEKKAAKQINTTLFVIVNYHEITKEIFFRRGEYTETLFRMMKIPKNTEGDVINNLRDAAITTPDIPKFAERVASMSRD